MYAFKQVFSEVYNVRYDNRGRCVITIELGALWQ